MQTLKIGHFELCVYAEEHPDDSPPFLDDSNYNPDAYYVGITAEIVVRDTQYGIHTRHSSSGLWRVETESNLDYKLKLANEELNELLGDVNNPHSILAMYGGDDRPEHPIYVDLEKCEITPENYKEI
jgi:hypothetical protein